MSESTPLRTATETRLRWATAWLPKRDSRGGSPSTTELQQAIAHMEVRMQQQLVEVQQQAHGLASRAAAQATEASPKAADVQLLVERNVRQAIMALEKRIQQQLVEVRQEAVEAATRTALQVAGTTLSAADVDQLVNRCVRQAVS